MHSIEDFDGAPGSDLVASGLDDLAAGRETEAALLVSMASTRLRAIGIDVPASGTSSSAHRLYDLLAEHDPRTAHSRYNALTRRLASFAQAAEHARAG
jgi:hypothetical protein